MLKLRQEKAPTLGLQHPQIPIFPSPPKKINTSNTESKVRWFSPYPKGEPPPKKHHWPILRPISCASGNRLGKVHFLNKSHVEQKGEATKKKNYSNPLSNHWKQKDPVEMFLLISIFDIHFLFQIKILIWIHSALGEKLMLDLAIGYALYLPPRMLARQHDFSNQNLRGRFKKRSTFKDILPSRICAP